MAASSPIPIPICSSADRWNNNLAKDDEYTSGVPSVEVDDSSEAVPFSDDAFACYEDFEPAYEYALWDHENGRKENLPGYLRVFIKNFYQGKRRVKNDPFDRDSHCYEDFCGFAAIDHYPGMPIEPLVDTKYNKEYHILCRCNNLFDQAKKVFNGIGEEVSTVDKEFEEERYTRDGYRYYVKIDEVFNEIIMQRLQDETIIRIVNTWQSKNPPHGVVRLNVKFIKLPSLKGLVIDSINRKSTEILECEQARVGGVERLIDLPPRLFYSNGTSLLRLDHQADLD